MIKYEVIHPTTKKVIATRNSASNREYHWAVTYMNPITKTWYNACYSNSRANAESNLRIDLDRIDNGYKDWTPAQRKIARDSCKGYAVTEVVAKPVAKKTISVKKQVAKKTTSKATVKVEIVKKTATKKSVKKVS